MFFTFFKLYKWYQIVQRVTYRICLNTVWTGKNTINKNVFILMKKYHKKHHSDDFFWHLESKKTKFWIEFWNSTSHEVNDVNNFFVRKLVLGKFRRNFTVIFPRGSSPNFASKITRLNLLKVLSLHESSREMNFL